MPTAELSPVPALERPLPPPTLAGLRRKGLIATVLLFAFIGVLSAAGRMISIALSSGATSIAADNPDAHYLHHLTPILLHLVGGLAFCVLGPLQFSAKARARWPRLHRVAGRVFIASAVFCGLSALWMNALFPSVGGAGKFISNIVFGVALTGGPVLALVFILRGDVVRHRAWMMRTLAVGLGVASQRLILLPYMALGGELTTTAIDVGVIAGWTLNLVVCEWVLRRRTVA